MIPLAPLAVAAALTVTARLVGRTDSPARARTRASVGALVALAIAASGFALDQSIETPLLGEHFVLLPPGLLATTHLVVAAIAVIAVAMAPLATHPPATLRRMLDLFAVAAAFVTAQGLAGAFGVVALWTLSAAIVWTELRSRPGTDVTARLFQRYQVPSALLLVVGTLLMVLDVTSAGVACCLIAIAIREATIPLHGWLPELATKAPMGIFVAFIAPQLGVYTHLMRLAGHVPHGVAHGMAAFGAATAVLAAALGLVQSDGRRALAFIVISQTGLIAFGLENESFVARSGALVTWQVLALAMTGFAMTLAALEARRGTLALRSASGSFARTPRMAVALLLLGFASVGLPTTLGFVAEDLLVQGSTEEFPLLGFALIVATALNGMTVMRCFFALFSGSKQHDGERDIVPREAWALTLALVLLFAAGLAPDRLLGLNRSGAAEGAPGVASD